MVPITIGGTDYPAGSSQPLSTVTPVRAFARVFSWQAEDLGLHSPSLQESNSLSASAGFFCMVFSVEMMR